MPAIYAHRAFGEDVKKRLSPALFSAIFQDTDSFALGLHGPDVLFYFHPLKKNAVNGKGDRMHEESAAPFFTNARTLFLRRGARDADRAFLYGFVCHFALDSVCHPEVDAQMARHHLTHTQVEAAFERAMLLRDGNSPVKAHIAGHIKRTQENISAVSAYCGVSEREAAVCIRSMVRCSRLLRAPNACKRALLRAALRIAGSKSVEGMIVPAKGDPARDESNAAIAACYERAVEKAVALLENYRAFLEGSAPLDERFSSNYGSEDRI